MKLKLVTGVLVAVITCVAQEPTQPPQPDNTKVNKANRGKAQTADRAKDNTSDRDLMQKIRQSIMADKSLSTSAHNVKVVARNGKVTLKGPVTSAEEKQTIGQKATDVAGAGNVTNEITVKPPKKSS